ncbi:uncharacterized protein UTRI_10014 [Ustilago trichophora]|uniref:Uncharacterized protein n=1 Tax=Ustilago trichophora TaxID=86804 RepID=A0A5C3DNW9_9BASI|nr:uncharacterized protein UTRI_10014 [Ustilago trichophora]
MKINPALIIATTLAILASVDVVAGTWLTADQDKSYDKFCGPNPTLTDDYHVCFKAPARVIKKIQASPGFSAYLSPKGKGFALVPSLGNTPIQKLETDSYTVTAVFVSRSVPGGAVKKCADIRMIPFGATNEYYTNKFCLPGGMPVDLPDKLPPLKSS